jgi:hypothetical protein
LDRYLLKNIIILILVLVNGFLLGALILRHSASSQAQHQVEDQLVALFAADDMELSPDVISKETPPATLSLTRDPERERAAAAFFLGSTVSAGDQSGDTCTYSTPAGVARFRSNSGFDIVGSLASGEEAQDLCRRFCRAFSWEEPQFSLDETGTGTAAAACLHGKLPVFNCTVTFTFDQGTLLTVSGTLLPESGTAAADSRTPLSAAAALTAFQQARRESYMAVSAVTGMEPGYALQGSTASALSLTPMWRISTDTADYYVNCITGTVSAG